MEKEERGEGEGRKKNRQAFSLLSPHPLPRSLWLAPFSSSLMEFQHRTFTSKNIHTPKKKMSALQANKTDTQKLETDKIGHFRVPPGLCIKTRLSACSALEMIFHTHANKTHFHKKGCALGLILKVRVFGTWKCPSIIEGLQAWKFWNNLPLNLPFTQEIQVPPHYCSIHNYLFKLGKWMCIEMFE